MYNVGGNSWASYMNNRQSSPYINMLEGYARNYMDPNSPYNMKQFAGLRSEGRSAAGQQFNQGMKMSAAGQNPFANQQYQGAISSNRDAAMNARNQQTNTNQQLGQGMLGMGMQARATQGGMHQQQQQWDREYRQHERGQWLGLLGTLASAGIMGPLAAKLTPSTTINNNMPEQMSPLAANMTQTNPTSGALQHYINSQDINPYDLVDVTSPNYQKVVNRFGEQGINDWLGQAIDSGIMRPYSPTPQWLKDQFAANPAIPSVTTPTIPAKTIDQPVSLPSGLRTAISNYGTGADATYEGYFNDWKASGLEFETWLKQSNLSNARKNAMRGMWRNYGGTW